MASAMARCCSRDLAGRPGWRSDSSLLSPGDGQRDLGHEGGEQWAVAGGGDGGVEAFVLGDAELAAFDGLGHGGQCGVGYGQTGPWAARPGYDAIAQAQSGMMSITGEPGGPPMRPGVATADIGAGMWAAIGILAALHARRSTARGQHVDISPLDGQLAWLTYVAGGYFTTDTVPGPHGSAHPTIVPYQALSTADGHLMVAAGNDKLWRTFAELLGERTLADDPRFATNPERVRHRQELIPLLEAALARRASTEWAEALDAAGVPCAPISTVEQALTSPQAVAREMVSVLRHPTAGELRTVGSPLKLSASPVQIRTAPPLLGQHTDDVLAETGYSVREIEELRATGAVR